MGKREQLATLLHHAGALKLLMHVRRIAPVPSRIGIVCYHHIAEEDPTYPYDRGVADATPAQFRRQMEMLARYGTPIGIDELIRAVDGVPLPKNPVMVTFDDGYRSCHDIALPILRAVGMRATFFVPTGFITDRRLFWWERVALVLSQARRASVSLTYPRSLVVRRQDPEAHTILTDVIKDTPGLDVERFLDELSTAFGVEWSREIEAKHASDVVMTWDQVRALSRAGMDVESHTRRHRVLDTLDADSLHDELEGSRRDLEAQLGHPVRAIAYPTGRRIAPDSPLRAAIAAAGYRIGLSNASGATRIWPKPMADVFPAVDPYDLRRLSTDRSITDAMFFTQVVMPRLAYIGRNNRE